MSETFSSPWTEEFYDILGKIENIIRCDLPADWILSPQGQEQYQRCYGYAYFLFQQKRYAQAKQLLIFLSLADPINFEVELAAGLCAKALGELAEALARFGKAMHLNSIDPRPIYFSAQIFENLKEWDQAWIFYDHAYKLALGDALMTQILMHAKVGREHCETILAKANASPQEE